MKFQIGVFAVLLVLVTGLTASANESTMREGRHGGRHHHGGQGWGHHQGHQQYGYERGQLFSSPVYCYGGPVCNTTVGWQLQGGNDRTQGLVTVTVVSSPHYLERTERIMSCGRYGNTHVPWIRPGDTYVFNLYASDSCSYIPYGRVLDSITIRR